jgi:hypothetical protein
VVEVQDLAQEGAAVLQRGTQLVIRATISAELEEEVVGLHRVWCEIPFACLGIDLSRTKQLHIVPLMLHVEEKEEVEVTAQQYLFLFAAQLHRFLFLTVSTLLYFQIFRSQILLSLYRQVD